MLLLAIDTSTSMASVALVDPPGLLVEFVSGTGSLPGVSLLPMLNVLLEHGSLSLGQVEAIAVACGPGAFTGLRVGMSCAKGLALALGKPVIGVPTLEAMAWSRRWSHLPLCPVVNAKRGEIYAGLYESRHGKLTRKREETVLAPAQIADFLTQPTLLFGDAVTLYADELRKAAPGHVLLDEETPCGGYAPAVAALAGGRLAHREPLEPLEPRYVRSSEAERKYG